VIQTQALPAQPPPTFEAVRRSRYNRGMEDPLDCDSLKSDTQESSFRLLLRAASGPLAVIAIIAFICVLGTVILPWLSRQ
jgi:hypothetical protein